MGIFQNLVVDAVVRHFPRLRESLRFNLLRGKLHLEDVHVAPSFFILHDLPLQVTGGNVGSLSAHVPWTNIYSSPVRIEADDIHLSLEEVPFASSQQSVFEAFRSESEQEKKRHLAEGERGKSPISRMLFRFLPMLLDRLEMHVTNVTIELKFASGQVGVFRLKQLSTTPTPRSTTRGDLDKLVVASGISFCVSSHSSNPVLSFSDLSVTFGAAFVGGAWHVNLNMPNFKLSVDASLPNFLHTLSMRASRWRFAYLHQRPNTSIAEDPRSWLKYAVRCASSAFFERSTHISEAEARRRARIFVEYKELHVKRLKTLATATESERLIRLEDCLDAEAILHLRDQARKHAMADEVSSFATRDWLGWALHSGNMSNEQEELAEELKHSLAVAEYGNADTASELSDFATTWSKIRFGIASELISIILTDHNDIFILDVHAPTLKAEADSSLEAYTGSLAINDIRLLDGERCVWQRRQDLCSGSSSSAKKKNPFVEAKIYKLAYDNQVTMAFSMESSKALFDDMTDHGLRRLRHGVAFIQDLQCVLSGADKGTVESERMKLQNVTSISGPAFHLTSSIHIRGLVVVVKMVADNESTSSIETTCSFADIHFEIQANGAYRRTQSHCKMNLSAYKRPFSILQSEHTLASSPVTSESMELNIFQIGVDINVEVNGGHMRLRFDDFTGFLEIPQAGSLINAALGVQRRFRSKEQNRLGSFSDPAQDASSSSIAKTIAWTVDVPSMDFEIRDADKRGNTSELLKLHSRNAVYEWGGGRRHVVRAQRIEFFEALHRSAITLGVVSMFIDTEEEEEGRRPLLQTVHSDIDKLSITLSLDGLSRILSAVKTINTSLEYTGSVDKTTHRPLLNQESTEIDEDGSVDVCVQIHRAALRCKMNDARILMTGENLQWMRQGHVSSGFIDALEVRDFSDSSSLYQNVLRCVTTTNKHSSKHRAVTYVTSHGSTNLHLSSLQFVWLSSFFTRVSSLVHSFQSKLQETVQCTGGSSRLEKKSPPNRSPEVQESKPLTLQGWNLTLIFPCSPASAEAICITSSHITATISSRGQVISMREGQVLSRSSYALGDGARTDEIHSTRVNPWIVLIRGIDVDLSHYTDVTSSSSGQEQRTREKWSIEVLRRASVFVAPSQIQVIQMVIGILFAVNEADDDSDDLERSSDAADNALEEREIIHDASGERVKPMRHNVEEFILNLETHYISAEILNETSRSDTTPDSVANIELDPTRLSWKHSSRYQDGTCETSVLSWQLNCPSITLEDRTHDSPGTRRVVLHTVKDDVDSRFLPEVRPGREGRKIAFKIEAIQRIDMNSGTSSSYAISLHRAQIAVRPTLGLALIEFWEKCFASPPLCADGDRQSSHESDVGSCFSQQYDDDGTENAVATKAIAKEAPTSACGTSPRVRHPPCSKVTISLISSNILLFNGHTETDRPAVDIFLESGRVVVLKNDEEQLVDGSKINLRSVIVSLFRYGTDVYRTYESGTSGALQKSFWAHPSGIERYGYGTLVAKQNLLYDSAISTFGSPQQKQPYPINRSSMPRNASFGTTEVLIQVPNINVKLPVIEHNRIIVNVPNVTIESPLESLLEFILMLSDLELIPELNSIEGPDIVHLPEIQATIGNISIRTRVETTAALLSEHELVRNHATVRLRGSACLVVAEKFQAIEARVSASGDVVDEERGICDPILSQSTVCLEASTSQPRILKIRADRLLRIALSPLTVRASTGIAFATSEAIAKYGSSSGANPNHNDSNELLSRAEIYLSVPGFIVRCFAEQPRAQLLRLVFRDVQCFVMYPAAIEHEAKAEVSIRDIQLEDTISPHLQQSGIRESRSQFWTTIVSCLREYNREETHTRSPYISRIRTTSQYPQLLRGSSRGEEQPSVPVQPIFFCDMSWYLPFEGVKAQLGGAGLDIKINMGIFPTFVEWFGTLTHEFYAVQRAQKHSPSSSSASTKSFPVCVDHIVVEPVRVQLCVSAPPKDLQLAVTQKLFSWFLGAETADGVGFYLPRVVFTGDFGSVEQFTRTFSSSYITALQSRYMLKQFLFLAPQLARMARVLLTSWARRRSRVALITWEERSVGRQGSAQNSTAGIGLLGAVLETQFGLGTHIRAAHDIEIASEDYVPQASTAPVHDDSQVLETIDISDRNARAEGDSLDGRRLFLWLRTHDHRIPRNERFEQCFSFSQAVTMLVTSRFFLFVNRGTRTIQEPIITRASIAEYHISGKRITIVTVRSDRISPARFAALQRERDAPSLARHLRSLPRISQIQMHEIECISEEYASWLLQQLPAQNENLRSLLYPSR